jgi:hypothetical protein
MVIHTSIAHILKSWVLFIGLCTLCLSVTGQKAVAQEGPLFVKAGRVRVSAFQNGSSLYFSGSARVSQVPQALFGYDYLQLPEATSEVTLHSLQNTHFYTLSPAGSVPAFPGGKLVGKCIYPDGKSVEMLIYRFPISANQPIRIPVSDALKTILAPVLLLNSSGPVLEVKGGLIDLDTVLRGKQVFLKEKAMPLPKRLPSGLLGLQFAKSLKDQLQIDSIRSFTPCDYYIATKQKGLSGSMGSFVVEKDTFFVHPYTHPGSGEWQVLPARLRKDAILISKNILIRNVEPVFGMPIATTSNPKRFYITDPAIEVLPNGDYIAACKSRFDGNSTMVRIYRSTDKGANWSYVTELAQVGFFNFFTVGKSLYIMGTKGGFNQLIIRRSDDQGQTWTTPEDHKTGLLRADKSYHSASVSTVIHNGRIWRAFEDNIPKGKRFFRAFMMSAPVASNLLDSASWTLSEALPYNSKWLSDSVEFKGWFEGNAVVTPDGNIVDILRVETWKYKEMAAIIHYDKEGRRASFDPQKDIIPFPGGEKKFTIKYDPLSRKYWSIANCIFKEDHGKEHAGLLRNRLVLSYSDDMYHWKVKDTVVSHPDPHFHGYQYPDWRIDGADIVMVSRTASSTKNGLPTRQHDANFFTFHRIVNFRK